MVLFVFVVAWAIMGAAEETWGDARTGVRAVRARARQSAASRFRTARTHPSRSVRWPARAAYGTFKTGAGVWHGTRATGRGVRRAGGSFRTGWRKGAARGRERHAARVERQRIAGARLVAERFPEPVRTSTATVKPVRTRTDEPAEESDPGPSEPVHLYEPEEEITSTRWPDTTGRITKTIAPGAEGNEDGTEPRLFAHWDGTHFEDEVEASDIEPSTDRTTAASAAPTHEGATDMSMPTGEANSYEQTQAAFKQIAALAQEFVAVVDNLQAGLQTANLDSETLGDTAEIIDAAQAVSATAEKALNGLESRHSQLHEAIVSASVEPADTGWYRG